MMNIGMCRWLLTTAAAACLAVGPHAQIAVGMPGGDPLYPPMPGSQQPPAGYQSNEVFNLNAVINTEQERQDFITEALPNTLSQVAGIVTMQRANANEAVKIGVISPSGELQHAAVMIVENFVPMATLNTVSAQKMASVGRAERFNYVLMHGTLIAANGFHEQVAFVYIETHLSDGTVVDMGLMAPFAKGKWDQVLETGKDILRGLIGDGIQKVVVGGIQLLITGSGPNQNDIERSTDIKHCLELARDKHTFCRSAAAVGGLASCVDAVTSLMASSVCLAFFIVPTPINILAGLACLAFFQYQKISSVMDCMTNWPNAKRACDDSYKNDQARCAVLHGTD